MNIPKRLTKSEIEKLAAERLSEYQLLVKEYLASRDNLYQTLKSKPFIHHSRVAPMVNVVNNVSRIARDFVRSVRSRTRGNGRGLKNATIRVRVLARSEMFNDYEFMGYLASNKSTVRNLLEHEIFREVNCTHFLMIGGISAEQFHLLIRKLGHNPVVVLSEARKERLRFAIDNNLDVNGKHPFNEILDHYDFSPSEWEKELYHFLPVMPGILGKIPIIKKWRVSRTHSLVYAVKNGPEKAFLIPVHVDPKNTILVLTELLGRKKFEMESARKFHRMAIGKDAGYVGTGLYDLGCEILIKLLQQAVATGMIGELEIEGQEKLTSSYSIYLDNQVTDAIEKLAKRQGGRLF